MPPKAASRDDKVKAVKGDEAEEIGLEYMKSVNRPYAVADVTANLKGKVTKLNVTKVLAALADKGSLTAKAYGKQIIYVYNQSLIPQPPAGEMEAVEQRRTQAKAEADESKKQLKVLLTRLETLQAEPATKDLLPEIQKLEAENAATLDALIPLREQAQAGGGQTVLTPEETAEIETDWLKWSKEFIHRKKIYNSLINGLRDDGLITDRAEFEDAQGIDFDSIAEAKLENSELLKPPPPPKRVTKRAAPAQNKVPAKKVC